MHLNKRKSVLAPSITVLLGRCSVKKMFLKIPQNSQVFSCKFCEIFKNTFFYRTPPLAASESPEQVRDELLKLYWVTFKGKT